MDFVGADAQHGAVTDPLTHHPVGETRGGQDLHRRVGQRGQPVPDLFGIAAGLSVHGLDGPASGGQDAGVLQHERACGGQSLNSFESGRQQAFARERIERRFARQRKGQVQPLLRVSLQHRRRARRVTCESEHEGRSGQRQRQQPFQLRRQTPRRVARADGVPHMRP